ncbi:hypothetical protein Pyn_23769 [Prunus yedoensis var. nudiflora]|uniref:Uncharacterized protein n=1 Tax=Prunus yedoensis var. nudiflora TaxID=2094558 RepID=A0A314ZME5_PRUYE|nr:hypothetical protein Pyn_23769 [Prunus yedoensis var. nudiflora]
MVAKSALPNPTISEILGAPDFFQRLPQRGASTFTHIFLFFLPLFMAKSDEEREMGAPAGLRDSILFYVPIPVGFFGCLHLGSPQQPFTCESLASSWFLISAKC